MVDRDNLEFGNFVLVDVVVVWASAVIGFIRIPLIHFLFHQLRLSITSRECVVKVCA